MTTSKGIELYPSYGATSPEIIYTLIGSDTNKDGKIDLRDNSVMVYLNRADSVSYALTLDSVSSYMPSWYSAYKLNYFNSENPNYRGVIVYAEQAGDNININMLPEYGVVPRRPNAIQQYDLAETYRIEDNAEYYPMALQRVHDFYGKANDNSAAVFCARAIRDAALFEMSRGRAAGASGLLTRLTPVNDRQRSYWEYMSRYLQQELAGRNPAALFEETLAAFRSQRLCGSASVFSKKIMLNTISAKEPR